MGVDLGPQKRTRQPLQVDRSALRGGAMRPLRKRPSRKRLKKLEGGWDSRNVKQEQILGKYDALTDDYCVFARGESFRRHFTEMVGTNSLELLQQSKPRLDKPLSRLVRTPDVSALPAFEVPIADMVPSLLTAKRSSRPFEAVVDDATMDTDDPTPLFKAWGEESFQTVQRPKTAQLGPDPLLNPPPIKYVDEPNNNWADPALGSLYESQGTQSIQSKINNQPPQIAIRVRGATGPLGFVEYDKEDTLRDLRKTLIDAQMVPSRDIPPRFAFVLPDGSPVPFKQEHLERVKGFGAHVYIHVLQTKRDHNVSPLGEEQQLQLMRSRNRGVAANEYGVKPTPKISPEYDYLPVVSYAEAADKARLGPLLAKIREIAGNAATELQKRVRIMLAKIQVDLMLHDPVLAAERARLRAKKQKELDEKRNAEARRRQEEADKRRKMIADQQSKERLEAEARKQAEAERARLRKSRKNAEGDAEAAKVKLLNRDRDGPALYRGAVQDAHGTHLLLNIIVHPEGLVLEAYTALTDDRVEGSVLQDQLCSVIEGWKTMSLDQKQKVCTSLSACTRVVGTEAPKLTADLDKMPFSKQEWYDLEIPISTQTSVQFEESGKSPEDLFRETQTAKAQLDPLLLCTSTQPGLGEVNAFEKGDSLKFVTQAKKELTVESAMWAATGYGPLSFLLRPEKEALAAVLSSDLELKNGQLALKVRASPRPDLAALVAPKTAAPDMGLKLRPSLDFAPGGDHAYKPPHVNEEDTPRTKAQNDPRAHALLHTPEAERPKSKSISRAASLTPPRSKDGKVDRGTGASRPTSAATTRKPRKKGGAETLTMEEIRRPITPGAHEGPKTDR